MTEEVLTPLSREKLFELLVAATNELINLSEHRDKQQQIDDKREEVRVIKKMIDNLRK